MIAWAAEALAASALLMLLVLALRAPARRVFGAEVAYLLWVLPAFRLALPPFPAAWRESTPIAAAGGRVTVLVLPAAPIAPEASAFPWFAALWLAGAALFLAWQVSAYLRGRARILAEAETIARYGRVCVVASAAADAPVAFGVLRPTIVVPRGWEARDPEERRLALAHERAHHARGDLVANWAALLVLALHWFNPVAWYAYGAFRADQEQATDARVLRRSGASPRAYARCLVAAAAGPWLSPACHLSTLTDLKRRLYMLTRPLPTRRRVHAGLIGTATLAVAGLALTASGSATGRATRAVDGIAATSSPAPSRFRAYRVSANEMASMERMATMPRMESMAAMPQGATPPARVAASTQPVPSQAADAPVPSMPKAATPARTIIVRPGTGQPITLITQRETKLADGKAPPSLGLPKDFSIPDTCRADGRVPPQAFVIRGDGDKPYTIVCTRSVSSRDPNAALGDHDSYVQALAGLHTARVQIAQQVDFPEAERARALAAVDRSIAELEAGLPRAK